MDKEKLLTVQEVADILDFSAQAVYSWIRKGRIDYIKLPSGSIRFKEEHVKKFMEGVKDGAVRGPVRG